MPTTVCETKLNSDVFQDTAIYRWHRNAIYIAKDKLTIQNHDDDDDDDDDNDDNKKNTILTMLIERAAKSARPKNEAKTRDDKFPSSSLLTVIRKLVEVFFRVITTVQYTATLFLFVITNIDEDEEAPLPYRTPVSTALLNMYLVEFLLWELRYTVFK
uniref:Uncharacterized protein n=1 Tax=Glossina pallidipes TaxID=7398 RepID=A0A1B0AG54_GLOPL